MLPIASAAIAKSSPNSSHPPNRGPVARATMTIATAAPSVTTSAAVAPMSRATALTSCAKSASISILRLRRSDDAAEPDVTRGRVDRLRKAGGWPVAAAVVRRAEMRPALQHLARDSDRRQRRIVAVLRPRATGIPGNAGRLDGFGWVRRLVPVRRPFPDVAYHVVEAV